MAYDIETYDYSGRQRIITDATEISFSSHYGDNGSGYGYLKFTLNRVTGSRYTDIGFGYRVKLYKGLLLIYDGMIREISEKTDDGVGQISVSALGFSIIFEDAPEILRNFCNSDLSKWITPSQIPGGSFRPERFSTSSSDGGLIMAATTQEMVASDYTELEFEFYPDEVASRMKCDILVNLGKGVAFDAAADYGVIFDGLVSSTDGPNKYVYYKDNSNDKPISVGMTLYNATQDLSNVITAVDTDLDRITVTSDPSSWNVDDEIYIRARLFSATITNIVSQTITYGSSVGSQSITTSSILTNLTSGGSVSIDSFDITAGTITVVEDISTWSITNSIAIETVSTPSSMYLFYRENSDETKIAAGMSVYNITQGSSSVIDEVNTSLNRIKCQNSQNAWSVGDEMFVAGPLFSATVVSVAGSVISYTDPVGEGNLSTSYQIVNLTKKDISGISSFDAGADTITASGDVSLWSLNDKLIISSPLFSAEIVSVASAQITFTGEVGLRIVNSDNGWVLHNETNGQVATVGSWAAPDKVVVGKASEVASWSPGQTISIYTPFAVEIRDSNDVLLWPASDWRAGAISGSTSGVNVTTTATPDKFRVIFKAYVAGSGDETSFVKISSVKVYSMTDDITAEYVSKEMMQYLTPLGVSSSEDEISAISKVVEPLVFEFKDAKEVFAEIAGYGSNNSKRIAWGLRLTDKKQFFVEEYPETVRYVISKGAGKSNVEVTADMGETVQRLRGVYTNALGARVIMDWVEETAAYFGNYYISRTETMSNIDNDTDATSYLQLILSEDSYPPVASSYDTSGAVIRDKFGNEVPFDEVKADGSLIEVEDFRAAIDKADSSDLSANWVRDNLVAVEIDIDAKSTKLIPGKARKTFEVYMSELSRIARL